MSYSSSITLPAYSRAFDLRRIMAKAFSVFFFLISFALAVLAAYDFSLSFFNEESAAGAIVKSVNLAIISLAIFELGLGVSKEYASGSNEAEGENLYAAVRRSITRFVAVVSIALVLEGLIMVIKYSQLELAGNLGYPVAIIASASLLLLSLGGFLRLTREA